MDPRKRIYVWIVIGVVVIAGVAYVLVKNGEPAPSGTVPAAAGGGASSTASQSQPSVFGTSPVNGQRRVMAPSGKIADNSAVPGTQNAPSQSTPVAAGAVPAGAVKITVTDAGGFSPATFTVRSGSVVTISLTGADGQTHVLRFNDPSLQAVAIGVGPGMTRIISFNAPGKSGEYTFHDDAPGQGHNTGQMIVK